MTDHHSTGALGEACAASYLQSLGYIIVDRNVRTRFGELDIITRDCDGTLAVVEVKTLTHLGSLSPEDNLTRSKFLKLSRMAQFYANKNPELVNDYLGWRIDLIAIILDPSPNSETYIYGKINFAVSHYKNITL